ncbi:MAG: P-loop NTPase [Candidatus Nealsonbacteria bacterium]|nr:P-loop NTPase [Candidatus Nealsonbacteria bacterium]
MNREKKKIAVASGKGGVGKSMIASSLAILFGAHKEIVAVDGDVDAPNLAIWLNETGEWEKTIPVATSFKPEIDYKKCNGCGLCIEKCRFKALSANEKGKPEINPFLCEGCGVCEVVCPQGAIKLHQVENGDLKIKKTKYDFPLVVGNLFPGETGSGKVITELKKEADKIGSDFQIVDCSPGTGCPVIACLQDADLAVLVTEPTLSAFSDLKRVKELVDYFDMDWYVVINKSGINRETEAEIEEWAADRLLGKVSYDKKIVKAVASLTPVLEADLKASREITDLFQSLYSNLST